MLLGLIVFIFGKPLLLGRGEPPVPAKLKEKVAGLPLEWMLYAVGLLGVAVIWVLIQYQATVGWILLASGIALLAYVLKEAFKLDHDARDRVFAMIFLILLMPVFWGLFEQAGGSVNLFTDRFVDRAGVPTSLFQSINPIYIILLGPLFAGLWHGWHARAGSLPRPPRWAWASCRWALLSSSWSGARTPNADVLVPVLFIFLFYLLSHHGRALPFAGWPVCDEPALGYTHGQLMMARVVLRARRAAITSLV